MEIIWKQEKIFMKEILDSFPEPKPAPTTIATLLKRMQDKKFVGYELFGNSRRYYPLVKKKDYFSKHVKGIIKNYFEVHNLNVNHFFIRLSSIYADSSKVAFELYHYNSFTKRKWIDDENERLKKSNPPKKIDVQGNLSGQDGLLVIDPRTNVVKSFIKWE